MWFSHSLARRALRIPATLTASLLLLGTVAPVLAAPVGPLFWAEEGDSGLVRIDWKAVPAADGYKLYRSIDGVNSSLYGPPIYTGTNVIFTDTVPPNSAWYYKVTAYDSDGETDLATIDPKFAATLDVVVDDDAMVSDFPSTGTTSQTGSWGAYDVNTPGAEQILSFAVGGDTYSVAGPFGTQTFTWTTNPVLTGNHDVFVTYICDSSRGTAYYDVYDGATLLNPTPILVDQSLKSFDGSACGSQSEAASQPHWKPLGTFPFTGNQGRVVLVTAIGDNIVADAAGFKNIDNINSSSSSSSTSSSTSSSSSSSSTSSSTSSSSSSSPTACVPDDGDLMAYWKFDEGEGSTAIDSSGNGNTATLINGVPYSADAAPVLFANPFSTQYSAGSSQSFTASDSATLDVSTEATVAYWFKLPAPGDQVSVSKWDAAGNQRSFVFQVFSDGFIYWNVSGDGSAHTYFKSTAPVAGTGWNHIAGTFDGSSLNVYLNGVLVPGTVTGTIPASIFNSNQPVSNTYNGGNFNTANLDDVRIYDAALTPTEIAFLAAGDCGSSSSSSSSSTSSSTSSSSTSSSTSSSSSSSSSPTACVPDDAGLLAYWKFDEGEGPIAIDSTGNGHTGTETGGVAYSTDVPSTVFTNPFSTAYDGVDDETSVTSGAFGFAITNFTVTAFIKPEAGNTSILGNFGTNPGGMRGWGAYVYSGPDRINFFGYGDGGSNDSAAPATLIDGNWHHIAGVYTRTGGDLTIDMYVDGVLVGTNTSTVGDINSMLPLLLGHYQLQPNFDGGLDDIRVYNMPLTAGQIAALAEGNCSNTASSSSSSSTSSSTSSSSSSSSSSPVACLPDDADLTAYWKFDEGEGPTVNDSTLFNNAGIMQNGPVFTASAAPTAFPNPLALSFDGENDDVLAADTTGIPSGNDPRTIALWMNQTDVTHQSTLVSMGNGVNANQKFIFMMGEEPDGGTTYLFTDGINAANNITVSGGEIPTTGVWHHVAFTYDGAGNWQYFLDGTLTKSGLFPVAINTVTDAIEIGSRHDAVDGFFSGSLDDVRIYSSVLTAGDIADLAAGECPFPVVSESFSSSSSSSSSSSEEVLELFSFGGPLETSSAGDGGGGGTGGRRGSNTNVVLNFLNGLVQVAGFGGDSPPPAFGGTSLAMQEIVCPLQIMGEEDTYVVLADELAQQTGMDEGMLLNNLNNPAFCANFVSARHPRTVAAATPIRSVRLAANGYPVSLISPLWNTCVQNNGRAPLAEIRAHRVKVGRTAAIAYQTCGKFRVSGTNTWLYPDDAFLTMTITPQPNGVPVVTVPTGYVVVPSPLRTAAGGV